VVCFLVCLFDFFFGNLFNLLGLWDNNNTKLGFSIELFCMHADLFLFTHMLAVLGFFVVLEIL
jgi:hypothetical protein